MGEARDHVFRGMSPEVDRDPLVNNGGISQLLDHPEKFTFEDMIQQLETDGGYRNVRNSRYANWTFDAGWLEKFTGEESIVLVAETDELQLSEGNFQAGKDLYIQEVPWSYIEEVIHPEKRQKTVEDYLGEVREQQVTLTPAKNVYKQATQKYGEKPTHH